MFDLPYILTHPLLKSIMVRHAELKEQAESLSQGSAEWKAPEKRISRLEQYRLPKEDERDAGQREGVFDESGQKIGEVKACVSGRSSDEGADPKNSRSRPVPKKNWPIRKSLGGRLRSNSNTKDALELRRAVRRLKEVLKSEGIRIPIPEDYGPACGASLLLSD